MSPILSVTDFRQRASRGCDLLVETQLLDAGLQHPQLIVIIIDGEIATVTEPIDMPAQHADTKRMKGGNVRGARPQLHCPESSFPTRSFI